MYLPELNFAPPQSCEAGNAPGYVPNLCSYSVLTPIIKSKQDDVTAISNYRPIALATIFSKLLT